MLLVCLRLGASGAEDVPEVAMDHDTEDLVALNDLLDESDTPPLKPVLQAHRLHRKDAAAADNDSQASTAPSPLVDGSLTEDGNKRAWGASQPPETTSPDEDVKDAVDRDSPVDADEPKRRWGLDEAADAEERTTADTTTSDSAESQPPSKDPNNKRMWGTASAENATKFKNEATPQAPEAIKMPFSTSIRKDAQSHVPPDGFKIKGRVYIDPADKLAHLSTDVPHVPYWDCGVTGST